MAKQIITVSDEESIEVPIRKIVTKIKVEVSNICPHLPSSQFIHDVAFACDVTMKPTVKEDYSTITVTNPQVAKVLISTINQKRFLGSFLKVYLISGSEQVEKSKNSDFQCSVLRTKLLQLLEKYRRLLAFKIEERYFKEVDVVTHKVSKCSSRRCKEELYCVHYHAPSDRRRPIPYPFRRYSSNLCKYVKKEKECYLGEDCFDAHNYLELEYHPISYKSLLCKHGTSCSHRRICPDIHLGTADSIYHDLFTDTLVVGLETSLDYLLNSVRLLYKVVEKPGVLVVFVTSTHHFTKFTLDVLTSIAHINNVSIIDAFTNIPLSSSNPRIVIGTPSSLLPMVENNKNYFRNLRLLIADDITALLYVPNKLEKLQALLMSLKAIRDQSNPLHQVAISEEFTDGIKLKASRILQTQFASLEFDNPQATDVTETFDKNHSSLKPRMKRSRSTSQEMKYVPKKRIRISPTPSSSSDNNGIKWKDDYKYQAFVDGYCKEFGICDVHSEHFKNLWAQFLCVNHNTSDNQISQSKKGSKHSKKRSRSRSHIERKRRKSSTLYSDCSAKSNFETDSSDLQNTSESDSDSSHSSFFSSKSFVAVKSQCSYEENIKKEMKTEGDAVDYEAVLKAIKSEPLENFSTSEKEVKESNVFLYETDIPSNPREDIIDTTKIKSEVEHQNSFPNIPEALNRECSSSSSIFNSIDPSSGSDISRPNSCDLLPDSSSTLGSSNDVKLQRKKIYLNLRLTKSLLVLKEAVSPYPNLKAGFDAFLGAFKGSPNTVDNVLEAFKDDDFSLLFDLIKERLKQRTDDYDGALKHCCFIMDFNRKEELVSSQIKKESVTEITKDSVTKMDPHIHFDTDYASLLQAKIALKLEFGEDLFLNKSETSLPLKTESVKEEILIKSEPL